MGNVIKQIVWVSCTLATSMALADGKQPVGVPGDWAFVRELSDEFNTTEVDVKKWTKDMSPWGERAWRPENVFQKDGSLIIKAEYDPHTVRGKKYFYTMGILRSNAPTTYGYFEARIKGCSKFPGLCPGFWLYSPNRNVRFKVNGETVCYSEIDIVEMQQGLWTKDLEGNASVSRIDCNLHTRLLKNGKEEWVRPNGYPEICQNHWDAPWDPRDDFHLYAVENSKEWIVWYIDGKEVARKPNLYWHLAMNVTLTVEARPPLIKWAGDDGRLPDADNITAEGFPSEMKVDYVRCWVRNGKDSQP
ncbi:Kappa-carrageenase precursor [Planctomycetes bacterium CA13]|uniref:Kappa-carrageenase n=1 Tax=Novipirellula herctigrandis TaxID=2527986 RepID=A0A5C5ZC79_9BACT|nr:Kappa-carrageenase precursor [Planctomycetes bacterium CA13]